MNSDCEALLNLYGDLQECDPGQQAERKAAFDSALNRFCSKQGGPSPEHMRSFVSRKWFMLNSADAKRVTGANKPPLPPPEQVRE